MPHDDLPLRRIDHVRFFVGNARQSAYFYRNAFGFDVVAYAGLETRSQARSRLRPQARPDHLCSGVTASSRSIPESQRLVKHGDGVQDIAIEVADVQETYRKTTAAGRSRRFAPPTSLEDEFGVYEYAAHPHLWRYHAYVRQSRPLPRRVRPRISADRPRAIQPNDRPGPSASRRSTTSSATSKKARWMSGSAFTRTCSDSSS